MWWELDRYANTPRRKNGASLPSEGPFFGSMMQPPPARTSTSLPVPPPTQPAEAAGQASSGVEPRDAHGRTRIMQAVVSGQLDQAVKLALSGADLACRDAEGRAVLELAVLSANREVPSQRISRAPHTPVPVPVLPPVPGTMLRMSGRAFSHRSPSR